MLYGYLKGMVNEKDMFFLVVGNQILVLDLLYLVEVVDILDVVFFKWVVRAVGGNINIVVYVRYFSFVVYVKNFLFVLCFKVVYDILNVVYVLIGCVVVYIQDC